MIVVALFALFASIGIFLWVAYDIGYCRGKVDARKEATFAPPPTWPKGWDEPKVGEVNVHEAG